MKTIQPDPSHDLLRAATIKGVPVCLVEVDNVRENSGPDETHRGKIRPYYASTAQRKMSEFFFRPQEREYDFQFWAPIIKWRLEDGRGFSAKTNCNIKMVDGTPEQDHAACMIDALKMIVKSAE